MHSFSSSLYSLLFGTLEGSAIGLMAVKAIPLGIAKTVEESPGSLKKDLKHEMI